MTDKTFFRVIGHTSIMGDVAEIENTVEVHEGDRFRSHHRVDYAIHRHPNKNATLDRIVNIPRSPTEYQQISDCIIYGEVLECREDKIMVKGISVILDWDPRYKPLPRSNVNETKWFVRYPTEDGKEPEIFGLYNEGTFDSFEILHFRGDKNE